MGLNKQAQERALVELIQRAHGFARGYVAATGTIPSVETVRLDLEKEDAYLVGLFTPDELAIAIRNSTEGLTN